MFFFFLRINILRVEWSREFRSLARLDSRHEGVHYAEGSIYDRIGLFVN